MTGPLAGRRILVPRPRSAGRDPLSEALESLGARVVAVPTAEILPPEDPADLDRAARDLLAGTFDWVVFTSARAVGPLAAAVERAGGTWPRGTLRVAAVGRATRDALAAAGIAADLVPPGGHAEALADALIAVPDGLAGRRVLFPASSIARRTIPGRLAAAGARVTEIEAYRTAVPAGAAEALLAAFEPTPPDAAAFTSPSTAENLKTLLGGAFERFRPRLRAVSIGPATSAALRDLGIEPAAEASPHDARGLADAVVRALSPQLP